jgi:hypothetical protein
MADDDERFLQTVEASRLVAERQAVLVAERQSVEDEQFRRNTATALAASELERPSGTPMQRSISQDHNLYNSDEFVDPFDVTSIFGLISKHGGERLRVFGLECGVKLLLKHADTGTSVRPTRATVDRPKGYCGTSRNDDGTIHLTIRGARQALQVAIPRFQEILDDPGKYRNVVHKRWEETAFVIVDNSNIYLNAQCPETDEGTDLHHSNDRELDIRVSVPKLCDVIRNGRHPKTQVYSACITLCNLVTPLPLLRPENSFSLNMSALILIARHRQL